MSLGQVTDMPQINVVSKNSCYSKQISGKPRSVRIIIMGAGMSRIATVKMYREMFEGIPVESAIY